MGQGRAYGGRSVVRSNRPALRASPARTRAHISARATAWHFGTGIARRLGAFAIRPSYAGGSLATAMIWSAVGSFGLLPSDSMLTARRSASATLPRKYSRHGRTFGTGLSRAGTFFDTVPVAVHSW